MGIEKEDITKHGNGSKPQEAKVSKASKSQWMIHEKRINESKMEFQYNFQMIACL